MKNPQRLKTALGILLSSDQPGEVMAAQRLIDKQLKKEGYDRDWLINWLVPIPGRPRTEMPDPTTDWRDMLDFIIEQFSLGLKLRSNEHAFVVDLKKRDPKSLSSRQYDWLEHIYLTARKLHTMTNNI